eukprot:566809-Pleurochrysis_carterae.AAC.1
MRVVPTYRVKSCSYARTSGQVRRVQNRDINIVGLVIASYCSARAMQLPCTIQIDAVCYFKLDEDLIRTVIQMTHQNQFVFAAAHKIRVAHDKHQVGEAPPPAALAARAGGHCPQGAMPTTRSSLPSPSF